MKFKRHNKLEHGLKQIDIAPLIDVIFQLLIFFMLSSSFTFQSGITVKLPKAVTSDIVKEENLTISVTSENIIYFQNKIVTTKELKALLSKMKQDNRLFMIRADRRASVGRVVDIWDLCRDLGIERINIATNQEL